MTCEPYNIVKDGNLFNATASGTFSLTAAEINALYDGDVGTAAFTLSGTQDYFVHLRQEFGESFDVCYARYYTDEPDIDSISVTVTTFSGSDIVSGFLESAGVYRFDINSPTVQVDITHTVESGTAAIVYQLELIPIRHETVGFGTSDSDQINYYKAEHSTANLISASPNVIPLYNTNNFDETVRVSVAPTLTDADNYIKIATDKSGTYYGLNEYGFTQPGPNPIPLDDDSFFSTTISGQWEIKASAQKHLISPTKQGLYFNLDYFPNILGGSTRETTGIMSKEDFTATSFTAEVEIQFLDLTDLTDTQALARNWFFVLTNSYPIPDVGYHASWTTDKRKGASVAGLNLYPPGIAGSPSISNLNYFLRWVDGSTTQDPRNESLEQRWTEGESLGLVINDSLRGEVDQITGPTMEDLEDILNFSLQDFTTTAAWHKWRISYDHIKKEISAFVDNISLGSRVMRIEPFAEACRLFIGFHGNGGVEWAIRNFKIQKDKVFRVEDLALSGTASATVSGTDAYKATDEDDSTYYVAPNPNSNLEFRIDFEETRDVEYYRIKQLAQNTSFSAYGQSYNADFATTAIVDFGGQKTEIHSYSNSSDFIVRSPTYSDMAVTVSGIDYINFNFVNYAEATTGTGALAIVGIEVYGGEYVDSVAADDEDERLIPWSEGRWNNLKQYGNTEALAIRANDWIMPGYRLVPEYSVPFYDFGYSSAENTRQFRDVSHDYPHAESLLSGPGGFISAWVSQIQVDDTFYFWKYFEEQADVLSVFWNSTLGNTADFNHVTDKFKFQYLIDGGDPNNEDDWLNIPPVSIPHPYTGGTFSADTNYQSYKQYLIDNNDGEYYTDYYSLPLYGPFSINNVQASFSTGLITGSTVPEDYLDNSFALMQGFDPLPAYRGYIEFDEPVSTRGIRLVIKGIRDSSGNSESQIGLIELRFFSGSAAGSYTSPVFDTGTAQNTERLTTDAEVRENTEVKLFYRSFEDPPSYAYDPDYEVWQMRASPGNSIQDEIGGSSNTLGLNSAVSIGDNTYFFFDDSPYTYDNLLDSWVATGGGYPETGPGDTTGTFEEDTETAGISPTPSNLAPDSRVRNNSVVIGDRIYVAGRSGGNVTTPRLMYYDTVVGRWELTRDTRPEFTEDAVMFADEDNGLLYFVDEDGVVSTFNPDDDIWTILNIDFPTSGSTRAGMGAVSFEGKGYVFGGQIPSTNGLGTFGTYIIDFTTQTLTTGASSPFRMRSVQAVLVPEERVIYIFPAEGTNASGWHTTMKYNIDTDSWEVPLSLMWSRDVSVGPGTLGEFFYLYKDHIFRYNDSQGLARAKVKRIAWSAGKFPDFRDPVWGSVAGASIPWEELNYTGELMPQERYFQFKTELHSYDKVNSPILKSVSVVTPQDVVVPASGTSNIYVKVGVSSEALYQAWYTGALQESSFATPPSNLSESNSLLYTTSEMGRTWNYATTVSGAWDPNEGLGSFIGNHTAANPWVVKNSETDYEKWFVKGFSDAANDSDEIYYVNNDDPEDFSGSQLVIDKAAISSTANGAFHPCVLKDSPTSYTIWYSGRDSGDVHRIIRATSSDGITWGTHSINVDLANEPVNGYDDGGAYRPSVLKEGSTFRMWYTGIDSEGVERILYTTSTDGISWEVPTVAVAPGSEGVLDSRSASRAFVLKDEDTYYMYYVGLGHDYLDTLIRAESPDGLEWFSHVLTMPPGGLVEYFDGRGVQDIFVIVNRTSVIPGEYINNAQIKFYNDGAAL